MNSFRQLSGDEMGRQTPESWSASLRHPVTLMLHNIRSMWNVGSMFRTADAAGIDRMVITGYTATPPRKEIDKTALGAQETVPWLYFADPVEAVMVLRGEGKKIFGLEITENSRSYCSLRAEDFPLVLLVGNEVEGIGDELLSHCDGVLEIPQYGIKHSLNVAVAAGVALFECVRSLRQGELL